MVNESDGTPGKKPLAPSPTPNKDVANTLEEAKAVFKRLYAEVKASRARLE
jgi:hypothetical protein